MPLRTLAIIAIGIIAIVFGINWLSQEMFSPSSPASEEVSGPQVKWLTPPNVNAPENAWGKLNQPGNSKSEYIPLPSDMKAIKIIGDGHRREDVVKNGKIVGFYVYNDDPIFHTFVYAFIPK